MSGCGRPARPGNTYCGVVTERSGRTYYCSDCEPVACTCPTATFDGLGQCRRCKRLDLRSLQPPT